MFATGNWRKDDGIMSSSPSELPPTDHIPHAYGQSSAWSLGVEEEFMLLDPRTLQLAPRIEAILAAASEDDLKFVRPELMQGVVEVASPICENAAEAEESLLAMRARLQALTAEADCLLASSGTHPFSRFNDQVVTDRPRYLDIVERLQWVARRELIFGLHVHVGVQTPDLAIAVFNGIRLFLPHMLALTANSPFWQGTTTGLRSARANVFASFPRSGMPDAFRDWDHWESLMLELMRDGVIEDESFIWWDVRMHPRFGTVEIRICDGQTRVEESAAIAALVQATAAWIGELHQAGRTLPDVPAMLIEHNKWNASRYGLEGEMLDMVPAADGTVSRQPVPTRQAIRRLIEVVEPYAQELGSARQLGYLEGMLETTGADRQLALEASSKGDLAAVTRMLVEETARVPATA
jgi:carboxylate-amine ligase